MIFPVSERNPICEADGELAVMTQPYMAGNSAAQGAIKSLTPVLASEYGPQGIRVNCVRGN